MKKTLSTVGADSRRAAGARRGLHCFAECPRTEPVGSRLSPLCHSVAVLKLACRQGMRPPSSWNFQPRCGRLLQRIPHFELFELPAAPTDSALPVALPPLTVVASTLMSGGMPPLRRLQLREVNRVGGIRLPHDRHSDLRRPSPFARIDSASPHPCWCPLNVRPRPRCFRTRRRVALARIFVMASPRQSFDH